MFLHQCSACDQRQLIFPSQIHSAGEANGDLTLAFVCWCGAEQVHETGRKVTHVEPVA